jgi:flagellar biosynthesis/type III secretory pathway protein FliH
MSQDEEERYLYLRQQMAIIDENSRLRTARNDGLEEGLAAGREEGRKAGNIEGRILERCRDVQAGDYTKEHAASKLGIPLADFEHYYEEFLQTGAITL